MVPFDLLGPFWGLTLLSILSGIGMLWVVGKTTPQKLVEKSRKQMDSAVYEIRLFLDSPKWVLRSLARLIVNSFLYLLSMMPAFLVLALPMGLMFLSLEARHGYEAISKGQEFVVSVTLAENIDARDLEIIAGEGISLTSPALYVKSKQQVFFRAQAQEDTSSEILFRIDGHTFSKRVVSDPRASQMAPERASGPELLLSIGSEPPLSGALRVITVAHETRGNQYLGVSMPWWAWWLIWMMISALALRKPMGVSL